MSGRAPLHSGKDLSEGSQRRISAKEAGFWRDSSPLAMHRDHPPERGIEQAGHVKQGDSEYHLALVLIAGRPPVGIADVGGECPSLAPVALTLSHSTSTVTTCGEKWYMSISNQGLQIQININRRMQN